jgi:alanyl-tRNA synthetase
VFHISERPVGAVGDKVDGYVDQLRRRRHRQAHTAQHILSATFYRLYDLQTRSVHLGDEYSAIELPAKTIPDEHLAQAETQANEVIAENVPIEIIFADSDKAASLPLRKEPTRSGELRIIRIGDDYDCTACGGTHCSTTGGVGLIKISATEKIRGRTLVKYLCGDLAREDYRQRFEVTDSLSRTLTCSPVDLPARYEKLLDEHKAARQELSAARRELLPAQAEKLAANAKAHGDLKLVVESVADLDPSLAGQLAGLVADLVQGVAVLYFDSRLVIAAAEGGEIDAGKLARELTGRTSLKGGGKARLAQFGGASQAELSAYSREILAILGYE